MHYGVIGSWKLRGYNFFGVTPQMLTRALQNLIDKQPIQDSEVHNLFREIKQTGAAIPHSPQRKSLLRQEIFSMIIHLNWPTFFMTISPADLKSPLVKFMRMGTLYLD